MNRAWIQLTCTITEVELLGDHMVLGGNTYRTYARHWYTYVVAQVDLVDAVALQLLGLARPL
jgi:hypothetical protein